MVIGSGFEGYETMDMISNVEENLYYNSQLE